MYMYIENTNVRLVKYMYKYIENRLVKYIENSQVQVHVLVQFSQVHVQVH